MSNLPSSTALPLGPKSSQDEQAFHLFSRPYAFLEDCAKKYGDCFTLDFKSLGKHVFFSNPEAIQQIFSGKPEDFHAGEGNAILQPFLGKYSLLTLDEKLHKRHRRMIMPAFQPQSVIEFSRIMKKIVEEAVAQWEPGQVLSMQDVMLAISLDVILGAIFGTKNKAWLRSMKKALEKCIGDLGANPLPLMSDDDVAGTHSKAKGKSAWDQFRRKLAGIDKLIYAEIKRRRSSPHGSEQDMLSLILAAKDEHHATLPDNELRDEIMTLIIAGHETTATTLAWAFYWIHREPHVLKKCLAELSSRGSAFASPYLDAILKETLRIYPVIPLVSRKLQNAVKIQGWALPPGVHATACIYLTHYRKDIFPDPHTFNPDRFLEKQFSSFEYYPFGGGARRCIGMYFAQAEMKIILSHALTHCSFALVNGEKVRPVRRSVTLSPSGGMKMKILSTGLNIVTKS